jgi:hypothetical protein
MNFYYIALGIMWCALWFSTALLMRRLPEDVSMRLRGRWHPWSIAGLATRASEHGRWIMAAAAALFAIAYVLGYAPYESAVATGRLPMQRDMADFYYPVQFLIDETPLRKPLLSWGALFGQRDALESDSTFRSMEYHLGTTPAWLYAIGWSLLGVACVLGPAWIIRIVSIRLIRRILPVAPRHPEREIDDETMSESPSRGDTRSD